MNGWVIPMKAYDLRELNGVYLVRCSNCLWKGYLVAGREDSVCPRCSSPIFALPIPQTIIPRRHQAIHSTSPEPYLIEKSMNPYLNPRKVARGFRQAALMEWEQSEEKDIRSLERKLQDAHKEATEEIRRRFGERAVQKCQEEGELRKEL